MKTRILVALAALLAAGCDTPSAIDDYQEEVRLDFTARGNLTGAPIGDPGLVVTGGEGEVVVVGRLRAPDPCQDLTAEAVSEGPHLRLMVHLKSRRVLCAAVIGRFEYTARLRDLAPGTYDLDIVHQYSGNGWGTYLRETQVTVR